MWIICLIVSLHLIEGGYWFLAISEEKLDNKLFYFDSYVVDTTT